MNEGMELSWPPFHFCQYCPSWYRHNLDSSVHWQPLAKEGRGAETITEIKTYFALRRVRTNMFIGRLVLRSISALVLKLNFEITIQL